MIYDNFMLKQNLCVLYQFIMNKYVYTKKNKQNTSFREKVSSSFEICIEVPVLNQEGKKLLGGGGVSILPLSTVFQFCNCFDSVVFVFFILLLHYYSPSSNYITWYDNKTVVKEIFNYHISSSTRYYFYCYIVYSYFSAYRVHLSAFFTCTLNITPKTILQFLLLITLH